MRARPATSTKQTLPRLVATAALGYLAGSIPSADIASRVAAGGTVDLRTAGSGNPGGANAAAVLGPRWGYAVMGADIAKSAGACRLGGRVAGPAGSHLAGTAAVVGHCFPVWSGFRGGKGVACSVGQCLATFPAYFPIDIAVAAATASGPWRQRAFAASTVASATWVLAAVLWWRRRLPTGWGPEPTAHLPAAAAASSAIVFYRFARGRRP